VTGTVAAAPAREPVLRLRGLRRTFGGVEAVAGVDLEVRRGDRRAVLGPNGAGKSTLFNLVTGEFPPSSGHVELFGRDVTLMPARKRVRLGVGRTYQTSRVLGRLSVADNLYLAVLGVGRGHLRPVVTSEDRRVRERARAVAARVGLEDRDEVPAGLLSHGERRQLEIGLALASDPRLLMLDEPAAGLSRRERGLLTRLLKSLEPAVTLIIIEHDMDVALTVADRVTMMHEGRILLEGTPAEIRASRRVHEIYLGGGRGE
jgi:branched-chain amino acid transport system ATP-binding protein